MRDPGDILLFALSAWRNVSWASWKRAFDAVQREAGATPLADAPLERSRYLALTTLDQLGHVDADFSDAARIFVAPPVLALLPLPGYPRAVACGSRSPQTAAALRAACQELGASTTTTSLSAIVPYAPARIEVQAESPEILKRLADSAGVHISDVPPAWALSAFSGAVDDYLAALSWTSEREINWPRSDFDPVRLSFGHPLEGVAETRLSSYRDPTTARRVFRLWRGARSAECEPDWGRYAVLRWRGRSVLAYDDEAFVAAAPWGAPLPPLFARALSLCAGKPPLPVEPGAAEDCGLPRRGFNLYVGVPPDVLGAVAAKVGQSAVRFRLRGGKGALI
jgi:hypothetical protein